jgi:ribosome-associated protein
MAAKKKVTKKAPAKKPVQKKTKAGSKQKAPASKKKTSGKKPSSSSAKRSPSRGGASKKPQRKTKRPSPRAKRPIKRPNQKPAANLPQNPEALALARTIAAAALEKKAVDVLIIDTRARGASVGYDYVVLASGDSDRQLDAIAASVEEAAKANNRKPTSVESSPEWVLSNFDDVVAHFFTPDKRGAYDLEGLWSDAPRMPLT